MRTLFTLSLLGLIGCLGKATKPPTPSETDTDTDADGDTDADTDADADADTDADADADTDADADADTDADADADTDADADADTDADADADTDTDADADTDTDSDTDADADADTDADADADTDADTDSDTDADVTIYDLQDGSTPEFTEVTVVGVVTARDGNGFFVQAEAGGPNSGLYVYGGNTASVNYPANVGARVEISGEYKEFNDLAEIDLLSSSAPSVAVLGSGTLPTPVPLSASQLTEQWEATLVQVDNPSITQSDLGFGEMELTDGTTTFIVNNRIHDWTLFPAPTTYPFDYARGILSDVATRKVEPRSDADLPPAPSGPTLTTVSAIQQGLVTQSTEVILDGLIVSGVDDFGFFAQQGAGPYTGIYVYLGTDFTTTWGTFSVGDSVTVQGQYIEYLTTTEIDLVAADNPMATIDTFAGAPIPWYVGLDDVVLSPSQYEGVLLEVYPGNGTTFSMNEVDRGFNEFSVTDGVNTLIVDDLIYLWSGFPDDGTSSFSSITGVMTERQSEFKIQPRTDLDLAP